MTEAEIIKALGCCRDDDCDNCPNVFGDCVNNLAEASLDLINRQKAEIDKLERTISHLEDVCNGISDVVRAEAIKEFAERLKQRAKENKAFLLNESITTNDIDEILQEMVGEEEQGI